MRDRVARHVLRCGECKDVIEAISHHWEEAGGKRSEAAPHRWVAIAAGVLVAVLLGAGGTIWWLWPGRGQSGIADLVKAAQGRRLVEARLSGGFAWAPVSDVRGGPSSVDPGRLAIAGVAARLRGTLGAADLQGDDHTLGIAYLLLGSPDEAVTKLDAAAEALPEDPIVLSDLAAGRIELGKSTAHARDFLRALDLAERALAKSPALVEARFNKALALEAIGLKDAAIEAWDDYAKADRGTPWATEAQSRAKRLREIPKPELWDRYAEAFARACTSNDVPGIETLMRGHPQEASEALMTGLGRWADLLLAGDPSAANALDATANGAAVMTRIVGDPLVEDAVAEIKSSATAASTRQLAEAHRDLAHGRAALDDMRTAEASRLLALASAQLGKVQSPYRDVAELYRFSCEYYIGPAPDFASRIAVLIRRHPEANKSLVGSRARWLEGLASSVAGTTTQTLSSLAAASQGLSALGFSADAAFVRSVEATVLWMLGRWDLAWDKQRAAFMELAAISDARRAQVVIGAAAKQAELQGERFAALTIGRAVLAKSKEHDSAFDRCDGLAWFASAAERAGQDAEAQDALREGRALLDRVADPSARARLDTELSLVESRLIVAQNPAEAIVAADRAIAWLQSVHKENFLAEAYGIRARAKERAGDIEGAARDYMLALGAVERQRNLIDDRLLQTSFVDTAWELARDIVRFEVDRGQTSRALALADRIRATSVSPPEKLAPELARNPVEALVRQLPPDRAVLFYEVLDQKTIVWVVRSTGVQTTVIPIEERALDQMVDSFRRELSQDSKATADQSARRLFAQVVAPLTAQIQGISSIVIVPDGRLHTVPWGALREVNGHRWIEDVAIAVAPSLRCLLGPAHAPVDGAVLRVVAVGNPAFDRSAYPGLPDLPAAAEEARTIGGLYRDSVVVTGSAATPERVLAESLRAQVLHVAAHAIPAGVDPDRSLIVLAPGGAIAPEGGLTARDLRGRDMRNLRLAILAGCRSGEGPLSRIEGPLTLARPLLEDGVANVIVTIWDLPDEASASIMVPLHRALREGVEPIDALRRAQLSCWTAPDHDPRACGGLQLIVNEPNGR
jgi:CHAT domain-containing protein